MAADSSSSLTDPNPQGQNQRGETLRNGLIALSAILLSILLFLGLRTQTGIPTLASLAKAATPLETAVTNGRPTLVEFYADWCTACQAMAPTVAQLERDYGDRVNFVMLNVDNDKWLPEVLAYRVDGIPHFEFLDGEAIAVGQTIGEQPATIFAANLEALTTHQPLPYAQLRGTASTMDSSPSASGPSPSSRPTDPRSHSAQAKASP